MAAELPFLAGIRPVRRDLAAGETLFRAGEAPAGLYRVAAGRIVLARAGARVHVAEAGNFFGESALFDPAHKVDAVAEGAAAVECYGAGPVLLHLKAHPDLALAFAAFVARRLNGTRARLELARIRSAGDRILAFLRQSGAAEAAIELPPLIGVARELGMTHEAFYRTLRRLVADGLVIREGRRRLRLGPGAL
ncbi:Crp/Fnr family transcriptional regulator [Magnetospirillum sp. UT-4]|uniref:Crp/Fnr family transcriptional regulator n=1 Tax=Magnetospirillum sp. UT-4 TaxID=2681467 RepID=UPI00137E3C0B|nr:Crp/Fnr family transcriptional regulator [Magnetospirillum sp. UT-4]CAA7621903.1 conserved hypothetical protein [Magnetospirillum sp. UT-4]